MRITRGLLSIIFFNKQRYTSTFMYIYTSIEIFKKSFWRLIFFMLFFVKYALINFRSPNQYTISIDLLSIRISIKIISIRIRVTCVSQTRLAHFSKAQKTLKGGFRLCIKHFEAWYKFATVAL